jgi:hypothetical protein
MSEPNNSASWSERDLLLLYAELSIGTSIADIAASLDRGVEEVIEKAASLKLQPGGCDAQDRSTLPRQSDRTRG